MTTEEKEAILTLTSLFSEFITDLRDVKASISVGFEKCDSNFIEIHNRIDALSGHTSSEFNNVSLKLLSIKDEIHKIAKITRYEEEISNLIVVTGGRAC